MCKEKNCVCSSSNPPSATLRARLFSQLAPPWFGVYTQHIDAARPGYKDMQLAELLCWMGWLFGPALLPVYIVVVAVVKVQSSRCPERREESKAKEEKRRKGKIEMKRKEMIGRWAGLSRAKQKEKGLDLWDVTAPTYSRLQWPVLSFTKAEGVVISASGRKPTTTATFPSSIWNSSNGREWDGYASRVCVCVNWLGQPHIAKAKKPSVG